MTIEYQKTLTEYLRYRNDLGPATTVTAISCINKLVAWLGDKELKESNVHLFVSEMTNKYEATYVVKMLVHIQAFTAWMCKTGYLKEDPAINAKRPRRYLKTPKTGYTKEEYLTMKDYFSDNPALRTYVIIAYHTGMSMIDVCTLLWGEVDLEKMMITRARRKMITRTQSTSYIPLIAGSDLDIELRRLALINQTGDECYVDPNLYAYYYGTDSRGQHSGNTLKWAIRNACIKLGMDIKGTHGFRRGLCSALANDPSLNQILATAVSGHKTVDQLKRYVTIDPKMVKAGISETLRRHFIGNVVDEG